MLDVQKIVSGKVQWHLAPVNVMHVILEAVESTRLLIEEKKIELSMDLDDQLPTKKEVETALNQAGYDFGHNVLIQASGLWSGESEEMKK